MVHLQQELQSAVTAEEEKTIKTTAQKMIRDARKLLSLLKGLAERGETHNCEQQALEDLSFCELILDYTCALNL